MATKVVMEALSPTMEEGRLVKWLKSEGDQVKNGDVLAEVETDKAVMELVARGDGGLRKQLAAAGDSSPVGTLLGVIAGAEENIDALTGGGGGAPAKAAPAGGAGAPAQAPPQAAQPGPSSGQQNGGRGPGAAQPEKVAADQRQPAGASSVPRSRDDAQGEASAPPQQKIAASGASAAPQQSTQGTEGAGNGGRQRSSPLARRLASERGVDLGQLSGSGPGGRIIKRDIEAAGAGAAKGVQAGATPPRGDAEFRDIPLTQIRKTIARRLAESIGPIPTFYLTAEYDLDRLSELRTAMASMGDEYKVSFNDLIMKAVATALGQDPPCNGEELGHRL